MSLNDQFIRTRLNVIGHAGTNVNQNEFARVPPEVIHLDLSALEGEMKDILPAAGLRAATLDSDRDSLNTPVMPQVLNSSLLASRASAVAPAHPSTSVGAFSSGSFRLADQSPMVSTGNPPRRTTTSGVVLPSSDEDADVGITPRREPTTPSTVLQPSVPQYTSHTLPGRGSRPPSASTRPPPLPVSAQRTPAGPSVGVGVSSSLGASAIGSSRSATAMLPPTSSAAASVSSRTRIPSGPGASLGPPSVEQSPVRSRVLSDASHSNKAQQMQLRDVDMDPDTLSDLELNRSIGRISRTAQLTATSTAGRGSQLQQRPPSVSEIAPGAPASDMSIASVYELGPSAQATPTGGALDSAAAATSDPPARVALIAATEFDEFFQRLCKQLEHDTRKVSHKTIQVDDAFKRHFLRLLHECFPYAEFRSHTHTVRSRPLPSAAPAEMSAWKQWRVEFDEMYIKLCVALQLLAKQQAPLQPLHTIKSFRMEVAQIVRDYMRILVSGVTDSSANGSRRGSSLASAAAAATGGTSAAGAQRRSAASGAGAVAEREPAEVRPVVGGGAASAALLTSQSSSASARQFAPAAAAIDSALRDAHVATLEHSVDTLLASNEQLVENMRTIGDSNKELRQRLDRFESTLERLAELLSTRLQPQAPAAVAENTAASTSAAREKEQLFELQLRNHKLEAELSAMQIRLRTYEQMQSLTDLLKESQKALMESNAGLLKELQTLRATSNQPAAALDWSASADPIAVGNRFAGVGLPDSAALFERRSSATGSGSGSGAVAVAASDKSICGTNRTSAAYLTRTSISDSASNDPSSQQRNSSQPPN